MPLARERELTDAKADPPFIGQSLWRRAALQLGQVGGHVGRHRIAEICCFRTAWDADASRGCTASSTVETTDGVLIMSGAASRQRGRARMSVRPKPTVPVKISWAGSKKLASCASGHSTTRLIHRRAVDGRR